MCDYRKIRISCPANRREWLVGRLLMAGITDWEEAGDTVILYVGEKEYPGMEGLLSSLRDEPGLILTSSAVPSQNWNAVWEKSYQPVMIADTLYIRAPFHKPSPAALYDLVIEPQMAFGTGHHETTHMMMEYMIAEELRDKTVIDFGCGTGILAILAAKMGASRVHAIEKDHRATAVARQNLIRNSTLEVLIKEGGAEELEEIKTDYLLANINKSVLTESAGIIRKAMNKEAKLIVSGILQRDEQQMIRLFQSARLQLKSRKHRGDWSCLLLTHDNA